MDQPCGEHSILKASDLRPLPPWLRPSEQGHVPLQAGMPMLDAKKLSPYGTPYHPGLDNLAWIARPPGAVAVNSANHISFVNCTFEHLASAGLDFQSGTHSDSIEGCVFRDIGGNGIQLGKFSDTNVETHIPYDPADERERILRERAGSPIISSPIVRMKIGAASASASVTRAALKLNTTMSPIAATPASVSVGVGRK